MYWEQDTRTELVAGVMIPNKLEDILNKLHFVDNLATHDANNKLWKIRPWLSSFRKNCVEIVPEENNSIDEMIVPFRHY